jgi:putative ABC transport system substrate-binding protein
MKRRKFMTLIGGAAAAWPVAARAQQPAMPVVGFLNSTSLEGYAPYVAAFRQGLKDAGYVEGQNVTIEYRWAEGKYDRLPSLAADLVQHKVTVIAATSTPAALAAKAATSTVPIVFTTGGDPINLGLVASLNRPGGNATGVSNLISELGSKRLGLLRELVPATTAITTLVNPDFQDALATLAADLAGKRLELLREVVPGLGRLAILGNVGNPLSVLELGEVQAAARTLGLEVHILEIRQGQDIAPAFEALKGHADALYVCIDGLVNTNRIRINTSALGARLPTMHGARDYVEAGGLMSYGPNYPDLFRRSADYVDKILHGAKPGDIPVELPTKFDLIINLTTAKTLGLEIPPTLLARADEVIE